nr:hypothetical protein [Kibdelosporangium sp. MJ126-NF4]CTQ98679.1 hypothetical protein [Kibdelosporangium sp. MJ126-NF4]
MCRCDAVDIVGCIVRDMDVPGEDARRQQVVDELRPLLNQVALPSADLRLTGGPPESATGSYLTGHPYLPEGAPWPQYNGVPMFCVVQVNFADVGALPGFPSARGERRAWRARGLHSHRGAWCDVRGRPGDSATRRVRHRRGRGHGAAGP